MFSYSAPNKDIRKPIVYLHIGKTGGTTLNSIFHQNIKKQKRMEIDLARSEDKKSLSQLNTKASRPDLPFDYLRIHEGNFSHVGDFVHSCFLLTWFRDPIQRLISNIMYSLRHKNEPFYTEWENQKKGNPVLYFSRKYPELNNRQTQILYGKKFQTPPENTLEKAIENLSKFSFIGITEHFDKSLILLKNLLNWQIRDILYVTRNENPRGATPEDFDKKIIEELKEKNKLDLELYSSAKKKMESYLDDVPNWEEQLNKFTAINKKSRFRKIFKKYLGI